MSNSNPTLKELNQIKQSADLIYDHTHIKDKISSLAELIGTDIQQDIPIICTIMNGGMFFATHLIEQWHFPLELDYLHVTRYGKSTSGQSLNWLAKPRLNWQDRTIVLLDDILDIGITMNAVIQFAQSLNPSKLITATLLKKNISKPVSQPKINYFGFTVEDRYVFGCGMDYQGFFRNIPEVMALPERNDNV